MVVSAACCDEHACVLPFAAVVRATASAMPSWAMELVALNDVFEHFPDPAPALVPVMAALELDGHHFAKFGPLYAGP